MFSERLTWVPTLYFHTLSRVGRDPVINREIWRREIPQLIFFESFYRQIRIEVQRAIGRGEQKQIFTAPFFNTIADDKWSKITLKWYGNVEEQVKESFPTLYSMCKLPGIESVMISTLEPGAKIPPHRGPNAGVLRVHLGIECPSGCKLLLDGQKVKWQEGRCLVWDDTYLHSVNNASDQRRTVVYIDVLRPLWFPSLFQHSLQLTGQLYFSRNKV